MGIMVGPSNVAEEGEDDGVVGKADEEGAALAEMSDPDAETDELFLAEADAEGAALEAEAEPEFCCLANKDLMVPARFRRPSWGPRMKVNWSPALDNMSENQVGARLEGAPGVAASRLTTLLTALSTASPAVELLPPPVPVPSSREAADMAVALAEEAAVAMEERQYSCVRALLEQRAFLNCAMVTAIHCQCS